MMGLTIVSFDRMAVVFVKVLSYFSSIISNVQAWPCGNITLEKYF